MPVGGWAKKRSGVPSASAAPSASKPTASSTSQGALSVSSASDDGFEDDKFHLPVDHQPFLLLPGWDRLPPPPEPPELPGGSSSGSSGSSGSSASSSASSDSGDEEEDEDAKDLNPPQQAAAQPPGFSCANCVSFKAMGSGIHGCENEDFQRWAGTDKLVETKSGRPVLDPTRACSDWFSPAVGPSAKPHPTRHNT